MQEQKNEQRTQGLYCPELESDACGTGLIANLKGNEAIEMIVKQPNQPTGMTYNGSFMIPFKGYNFVIKMQAVEAGMTGIREAITMEKWMQENGVPEMDENGKVPAVVR